MSVLDMWHLWSAARRRRKEQWYQPERLAELRAARLRRLAALAFQAPYYRELFDRARIAPEDLTEASLERLPVLEKAALRSAGDGMLPSPNAPMFSISTSGSTG